MKQLGYLFVKLWISVGLFCYYKKIKVVGMEKIPDEKPTLFLSNHQNALLDVLLIATRSNRKLWFIARSDVFKGPLLTSVFGFLQMLPIYRIRDGKEKLHKNSATFKKCADLLNKKEAILLFPEANHSLKRNVRPLSKGFTRIISAGMEKNPDMDLKVIPIGQNYKSPRKFGDSARICFGEPIHVQEYIGKSDFVPQIKQHAYESLKQLTTHIPEDTYVHVTRQITNEAIYLNPKVANEMIANESFGHIKNKKEGSVSRLAGTLFYLWNLPMVFLWRILLKPKVPEAEFEATFRFGFALVVYPLFYLLGILALGNVYGIKTACLCIFGHAVFNILLVKIGVTSSDRRK